MRPGCNFQISQGDQWYLWKCWGGDWYYICCALLLQFCFLLQIAIPFYSYLTEELCSKAYTIKLYIVVSQHSPQSLSFSLSCPTSSYFLANPLSIFSISLSPLNNKTWETQNWYKYISILTQIFCYAFFALIFQFSGICSLHAFILSHRSLLMFHFGFYIVISLTLLWNVWKNQCFFFSFLVPTLLICIESLQISVLYLFFLPTGWQLYALKGLNSIYDTWQREKKINLWMSWAYLNILLIWIFMGRIMKN